MPSTHYHADSAAFALPAGLKDKTVHMFTLQDDGPSEFSVVVSHADTQPEEQLDGFGSRLMKELERALPKFQLRGMKQRMLDGSPAVELSYSWRNEGIFMHQRQAITLVQGPVPGSTQAMLIAATCLKAFSDEWNQAFDDLLDSVRLRRPLAPPAEQEAAWLQDAGGPPLPCVFAFSERRRTLRVFADQDEACRKTDAREVEQNAWAFFDGDGRPLSAAFVVPNAGTPWGKAGHYVLAPAPAGAPGLLAGLQHAAVLQCSDAGVQFATIDELRLHLERRASGQAADAG